MSLPFSDSVMLLRALRDAGVPLPENTTRAELFFQVGSAVVLRIEMLVDAQLLHRLATAIAAHLVSERLLPPEG